MGEWSEMKLKLEGGLGCVGPWMPCKPLRFFFNPKGVIVVQKPVHI